MEVTEIKEVGRLLKIHRLMDELTSRIQNQVPGRTGVKDSVYRAFRDADTNTEYMAFIRHTAKQLLCERGHAGSVPA